MKVKPAGQPAETIRRSLDARGGPKRFLVHPGETLAFRTKQGSVGVLQTVLSSDTDDVTVRYRLLKEAGSLRTMVLPGNEDTTSEIKQEKLEKKIRVVEALCTPAKGTLRDAIVRRYGEGFAVTSHYNITKSDNPASKYWLYKFCEKGSLLVCYDSESLSEVQWARYLESYSGQAMVEPLTDEEKLQRLKLRLKQLQLILLEHSKRFGKDTETSWGKAVSDVRVRMRFDRKTWPVGSDPSFQFDIGNKSNRTLFIAYPQSFKVEVDGQWHEANYTAYGYPRSIGTDGQMTYSVLLGDFLSDGSERLSVGKHTVRVAMYNIGERDESMDEKTPIRFGARKFEAISNPIEIEVVEPGKQVEDDWGRPVRGVRMRMYRSEQQLQFGQLTCLTH